MALPLTETDKFLLLSAVGAPETRDRIAALLDLAGTGNMTGPASATDNAVVRYDGATGALVQNSGVLVDDSNNISGVNNLSILGQTTMVGTSASAVIVKALAGNSNGLRFYANSATDVASIVNFYNANLELGTNNVIYQVISNSGAITLGISGGAEQHQVNGSLVTRRDFNGATLLQIRNDNTGASAAARLAITSDQGDFNIRANSGAGGDSVELTADSAFSGGLDLSILGSNTLRLRTNGVTGVSIDGNQKVTLGTGTSTIHQINSGTATAGADVMTMTNGPTGSAGDPAVFLKLNINGTGYVIPAWNFT